MNKILNFPLGKIANTYVYFKKVVSLIELALLKIKISESAIKAGILAGSLLMASPYANAKENMQLNPQSNESSQELSVMKNLRKLPGETPR